MNYSCYRSDTIGCTGSITDDLMFVGDQVVIAAGDRIPVDGLVERGVVTLVGATTENPSFELNSARTAWTGIWSYCDYDYVDGAVWNGKRIQ